MTDRRRSSRSVFLETAASSPRSDHSDIPTTKNRIERRSVVQRKTPELFQVLSLGVTFLIPGLHAYTLTFNSCIMRNTKSSIKGLTFAGPAGILEGKRRPGMDKNEATRATKRQTSGGVSKDRHRETPEEIRRSSHYQGRVVRVRSVGESAKEIRIDIVGPMRIRFRAGQYVQVEIPREEGSVYRAYSIATPEMEQKAVELVVKHILGGGGSTYLCGLKNGDPVTFAGPFGQFSLSEDPEVELICVSGGCGIAPLRSIVPSLYARWPGRSCQVFFGARTVGEVLYREEFRDMERRHRGLRVMYAISEAPGPGERWGGEMGMVHSVVMRRLQPGGKRQAFLCGPELMIDAVVKVLKEKGIREGEIYYDMY